MWLASLGNVRNSLIASSRKLDSSPPESNPERKLRWTGRQGCEEGYHLQQSDDSHRGVQAGWDPNVAHLSPFGETDTREVKQLGWLTAKGVSMLGLASLATPFSFVLGSPTAQKGADEPTQALEMGQLAFPHLSMFHCTPQTWHLIARPHPRPAGHVPIKSSPTYSLSLPRA